MPSKNYIDQNVYDALQERLDVIFEEFQHVMIAVSGGKDSGVLFNAVYDYAKQHNSLDKLAIYFLDYEVQYSATMDYVHKIFSEHDDIERYWLALPNDVPSATSMTTGVWTPWDKDKQDLWVREMPEMDYVINEDNVPFNYTPHNSDYAVQDEFTRWYASSRNGLTSVLIGIRADESMDRYRTIKSEHKVNGYKDFNYLIKDASNKKLVKAYPLYDWTVRDVWIANAKCGYDYNHIYDLFYQAGVSINDMRVASPFLSQGMNTLKLYQAIEPDLWGKMISRVNGVNFAGLYGGTTLMGWKNIKKPDNLTWKQYVEFLLKTLPKDTREDYQRIFATSIKFWRDRGGVLSQQTIEELNELGMQFEIKGKTNYKTDKKAVVFQDYPDDADVTEFKTVPSYKRMAITILKNDHTAKYMGFSRTKEQVRKRKAAIEKYQNIL